MGSELKTAIGLMSGTSMDGIDVALVKTDGRLTVEFGPTLSVDYPVQVRRKIERGLEDATQIVCRNDRPGSTHSLEQELTHLHGQAVLQFLQKHNLRNTDIDVLGFHGQTVLHRPESGLTVQLGDGAGLARSIGIDVVYDMRANDMIFGGQGAPLVPVFHQALANSTEQPGPVCFVNIGGISNISYIDGDTLIAFDSGPGNALIDQFVHTKGGIPYDQGGKIASEGVVVPSIVDSYMAAPFFSQTGPKSLDRNDFAALDPARAELSDGARTLAHVTALSIIGAANHLPKPPACWIIAGGGRLNEMILSDLKSLAAKTNGIVMLAEDADLDGDMLEAQAFGYLAVRSQRGLALTYPTTTGCREAATGGVFVPANSAG